MITYDVKLVIQQSEILNRLAVIGVLLMAKAGKQVFSKGYSGQRDNSAVGKQDPQAKSCEEE